jgi:hypothetical protein
MSHSFLERIILFCIRRFIYILRVFFSPRQSVTWFSLLLNETNDFIVIEVRLMCQFEKGYWRSALPYSLSVHRNAAGLIDPRQ